MSAIFLLIAVSVGAALAGSALGSWLFRSGSERMTPKPEPQDRVRRGRAFNAREIANLESWGVKVRDDEREPASVAGLIASNTAGPLLHVDQAVRRQWWDSKRGIWRDEETGRKV